MHIIGNVMYLYYKQMFQASGVKTNSDLFGYLKKSLGSSLNFLAFQK